MHVLVGLFTDDMGLIAEMLEILVLSLEMMDKRSIISDSRTIALKHKSRPE